MNAPLPPRCFSWRRGGLRFDCDLGYNMVVIKNTTGASTPHWLDGLSLDRASAAHQEAARRFVKLCDQRGVPEGLDIAGARSWGRKHDPDVEAAAIGMQRLAAAHAPHVPRPYALENTRPTRIKRMARMGITVQDR